MHHSIYSYIYSYMLCKAMQTLKVVMVSYNMHGQELVYAFISVATHPHAGIVHYS